MVRDTNLQLVLEFIGAFGLGGTGNGLMELLRSRKIDAGLEFMITPLGIQQERGLQLPGEAERLQVP